MTVPCRLLPHPQRAIYARRHSPLQFPEHGPAGGIGRKAQKSEAPLAQFGNRADLC